MEAMEINIGCVYLPVSDCKYPDLWKKPNTLYLSSWVIHGSCVGQSWVSLEKWGDKLGICPRWTERGAARGQGQSGSSCSRGETLE